MIASIAGVALALQLGLPAHPLNESIPLVQEIRYRRHGRSPPCGHGYDLDERDLGALSHLCCLKPCNTVFRSIRRHAAMAGI
jgi:hypothetical protein